MKLLILRIHDFSSSDMRFSCKKSCVIQFHCAHFLQLNRFVCPPTNQRNVGGVHSNTRSQVWSHGSCSAALPQMLPDPPWHLQSNAVQSDSLGYEYTSLFFHLTVEHLTFSWPEGIRCIMATRDLLGSSVKEKRDLLLLRIHLFC